MSKNSIMPLNKNQIAWRAAQDIKEGMYINLGIGLPVLMADYIDKEVIYHSENGILGMGPKAKKGEEDPDLIDAAKNSVTIVKGGCYFDSAMSFAMIRGGHLDAVFLGAFEVAENGDIANWSTGDSSVIPSVGGAMDLVSGVEDVRVLMSFFDKRGKSKLVKSLTYPITGKNCVKRIYTDLAVIDVINNRFVVKEIIDNSLIETLQKATTADLILAENLEILKVPESI
ncbi:MAG: 3-oxoacid CoA-transferase subunit B [Nitrososphaeria archaeon]